MLVEEWEWEPDKVPVDYFSAGMCNLILCVCVCVCVLYIHRYTHSKVHCLYFNFKFLCSHKYIYICYVKFWVLCHV